MAFSQANFIEQAATARRTHILVKFRLTGFPQTFRETAFLTADQFVHRVQIYNENGITVTAPLLKKHVDTVYSFALRLLGRLHLGFQFRQDICVVFFCFTFALESVRQAAKHNLTSQLHRPVFNCPSSLERHQFVC